MTNNNKIQANSIGYNTIQADLTEQLYTGNLPTGHYYFNNGVETYIVLYSNANTKDRKMQEPVGLTVLNEVPSYEGFMTLVRAYDDVVDENAQLKELLKECLEVLKLVAGETIYFPRTVDKCIDKINQALGEDK